jgi:hypothetical protein
MRHGIPPNLRHGAEVIPRRFVFRLGQLLSMPAWQDLTETKFWFN